MPSSWKLSRPVDLVQLLLVGWMLSALLIFSPLWLISCVNLTVLRDTQTDGEALFLGVSTRVFLEETEHLIQQTG